MGDVRKNLIGPFVDLYGPPNDKPNPTAFVASFVKFFASDPDHVLRAAADHVIRNRRYMTWPSPGDVTAAIEEIKRAQTQSQATARPAGIVDLYTTEPMLGWRESPIDVAIGLYVHVEGLGFGNLRTIDASKWSPRFANHPTVQAAQSRGDEQSLRANVRRVVRVAIRQGIELTDCPDEYLKFKIQKFDPWPKSAVIYSCNSN